MLEELAKSFERLIEELGPPEQLPTWGREAAAALYRQRPKTAEDRRFPRYVFQSTAVAEWNTTLPGLPRSERPFVIHTKDVSRAGIGWLHSEQLFPVEILDLYFPDGSCRQVRVVRCRKLADRVYEVGSVFI